MTSRRPVFRSHDLARVLSASVLGLVLVAGCGDKTEVPLVKVTGTVKVGGATIPMGMVEFHPDEGKGNSFKGKATGMIKSDGVYTLSTGGREGAPLGWYKVTVSGQGMPDASQMPQGAKAPTPPAVNAKYGKPESSGFSIEVKDGAPAGAYDLALIK